MVKLPQVPSSDKPALGSRLEWLVGSVFSRFPVLHRLASRLFIATMSEAAPLVVCPITRWYYKRMAILGGMLLVFAFWFFKDGKWTWPAERAKADKYEWFQKEVLGGFDEAQKAGTLAEWITEKRAEGYPLTDNGEPMKWVAYAASLGWPEKPPKKRTDKEIEAQFHWAAGMGIAALLVGVHVLLNRRKVLKGYSDHFITPEGKRVNFADAYRIDKRPWDIKGLAYVHHRPGGATGTGSGSKATIDDLKYDGAAKVLDLLLANFKGELIEKVPDPEEDEPAQDSPTP